jgi:hypothetical protein
VALLLPGVPFTQRQAVSLSLLSLMAAPPHPFPLGFISCELPLRFISRELTWFSIEPPQPATGGTASYPRPGPIKGSCSPGRLSPPLLGANFLPSCPKRRPR